MYVASKISDNCRLKCALHKGWLLIVVQTVHKFPIIGESHLKAIPLQLTYQRNTIEMHRNVLGITISQSDIDNAGDKR